MTTASTVGRREEADLKSSWASGRSTQLCTQHCHPWSTQTSGLAQGGCHVSPAWLSSCPPSISPSSCTPLLIQLLQRGILGTMSLLNPVLLPPKVKAYLSQGERFIKWDDVSGAGAVGCWGAGMTEVGEGEGKLL